MLEKLVHMFPYDEAQCTLSPILKSQETLMLNKEVGEH